MLWAGAARMPAPTARQTLVHTHSATHRAAVLGGVEGRVLQLAGGAQHILQRGTVLELKADPGALLQVVHGPAQGRHLEHAVSDVPGLCVGRGGVASTVVSEREHKASTVQTGVRESCGIAQCGLRTGAD